MTELDLIAKKADAIIRSITLSKKAFVPAQPAEQPQQAPAQYPPELLQAAQQMGIPIGQDGIPVDPQSGQPIPPEVLQQAIAEASQQGQPQGGQPAPQQAPAQPAQDPNAQPGQDEVFQALSDLADAITQLNQEQANIKAQIQEFHSTVAAIDGKMEILLKVVKTPAPGEAAVNL
jgi:hypothetical protein